MRCILVLHTSIYREFAFVPSSIFFSVETSLLQLRLAGTEGQY